MRDALGAVDSVLVIGGGSEIGLAIARELVGPRGAEVILAARRPGALDDAAARLRTAGASRVERLPFDALDPASHERLVDRVFAGGRDLDVAIAAVGVLGDPATAEADPAAAREIVEAGFCGMVSVLLPLARRMRAQGHGTIVVLSSVAAERPRRSNYLYGAAKAGLDAFARGLAASLDGSGVGVLVVRPGFVRTAMTAGRRPAPFAVGPEAVAAAVVSALARRDRIVWVPRALRWLMLGLRALPEPVFRRLPL